MTGTRRTELHEIPGAAPDLIRAYDLATLGYEETEHVVAGTATAYELAGARGADGRWEVTPSAEAPYRTRILVRRPSDPARFSGTVVVEWHNVSAGMDTAPGWLFVHRHLAAHGHAWVGVSAQKVGIDGGGFAEGIHLKVLDPDRYGTLEHPGDAWSFDIFSQAAALVRRPGPENPLGGLGPSQILALGESQSAACLVTYINAVDPHERLFDGFLVQGRPGTGVAIDGTFVPASRAGGSGAATVRPPVVAGTGERIREDARVPVLVFQSETDVILLGGGRAAQPDSPHLRVWELAGAAHADTYTVHGGRRDDGTLSAAHFAALVRPTTGLGVGQSERPINAGIHRHYVAQAAVSHLVRWAAGGDPPPAAPRLELDDAATGYRLDERGVARGGIRTPWTDVPTARLSGLGQGGEWLFAMLFGCTEPFDEAALAELYPGGKDEYLDRFAASLDGTIAAGFILTEDRDEILALVAATSFPLAVSGR